MVSIVVFPVAFRVEERPGNKGQPKSCSVEKVRASQPAEKDSGNRSGYRPMRDFNAFSVIVEMHLKLLNIPLRNSCHTP